MVITIRTRFGGNANSKKMQKAVYKQQFKAFSISSSEGLEKGYDRFQQLLLQLEAHGVEVSTKDANHKFLRSLPLACSNLAMTMRTKPYVDILSIDNLYNNLKVFEPEIKSASKSSTSAQNVAFISHSKGTTNKVKPGHKGDYSTYTPSTSTNYISEREAPADLEQIDDVDIEEMDINGQIAMIAIRMKKFYKKTGSRVRMDGKAPNAHQREPMMARKRKTRFIKIKKLGDHTAEKETNHALMAIISNSEVSLCSKTCIDSYNKLKALCDEQMNQLGEQEAKIISYTLAVKKLESQVATFQKQQLSLTEQLTFKANEIYEKDEKLKKYRRIGMRDVKEKDQLKKIVDSWKDSSKNLWKLIDSEEDYVNKPLYSRFTKTNNFKGVPHPLSGDYTSKPQEEIDESLYVYVHDLLELPLNSRLILILIFQEYLKK
ncbi:hypothetical protein Tco_1470128 [Tanacetum coccineum]